MTLGVKHSINQHGEKEDEEKEEEEEKNDGWEVTHNFITLYNDIWDDFLVASNSKIDLHAPWKTATDTCPQNEWEVYGNINPFIWNLSLWNSDLTQPLKEPRWEAAWLLRMINARARTTRELLEER